MKKQLFILFLLYVVIINFSAITIIGEKSPAWAYTHLVCKQRFTAAADYFRQQSAATQQPHFNIAADVLQQHDTTQTFDYWTFYQQYILPTDTLFSDDFFQKTSKNEIKPSKEVVLLGKILFYDPILSKNEKRSCASCHRPEKAFCDQRITSRGFHYTSNLTANSPSLLHAKYENQFFHDGRAKDIAAVVKSVIHHPQEFNNDTPTILARLQESESYKNLCKKTFNTTQWTDSLLYFSLTAFVKSLGVMQTPFDASINNPKTTVADLQNNYNTFINYCGECHTAPTFGGVNIFEKEMISLHHIGEKKIKTPSLRNLPYTMPYFHDGRTLVLADIFKDEQHGKFYKKIKSEKETLQILDFLEKITVNLSQIDTTINFNLPVLHSQKRRTIGGLY
jgi:cytochrome c peroxidase